jgi:hypothetical protein
MRKESQMVDISIQIEAQSPKPHRTGLGNTETRYRVFRNGEELGIWRFPEHSAARKLLELGVSRDDVLHTFRGSTPSMQGRLGWFADHTIQEDDKHGGPRFVKWRPMPDFSET